MKMKRADSAMRKMRVVVTGLVCFVAQGAHAQSFEQQVQQISRKLSGAALQTRQAMAASQAAAAQATVVNLDAKSVRRGAKFNNTIPAAVSQTANSPLIDTVDKSYFQQLQNLYARGVRTSEENLTGWFAGRCYQYDSPSSPEGALLVGMRAAVGGDNGPLFPPKSDFRISSVVPPSGTDFFDHMTGDKESRINRWVNSDFGQWGTAVEIDGALASKCETCNLEYRIRKYNSFFIASMIVLRDDASHKAGSVYAACYYFKKVH